MFSIPPWSYSNTVKTCNSVAELIVTMLFSIPPWSYSNTISIKITNPFGLFSIPPWSYSNLFCVAYYQ